MFLFQGLAFTHEERQLLGIHGLLPAVVKNEDEQVQHATLLLDRLENDLDKFIYLAGLCVSIPSIVVEISKAAVIITEYLKNKKTST